MIMAEILKFFFAFVFILESFCLFLDFLHAARSALFFTLIQSIQIDVFRSREVILNICPNMKSAL